MGYFTHLETLPPDPILELMWAFKKDPRQKKIDLSVGIYYGEHPQLEVLKCVKKAEEALLQLEADKAYLPIDGHAGFINDIKKLLFGEKLCGKIGKNIYGAQTVGGTGALRVGGEFLAKTLNTTLYVSDPTWANHITMFPRANLKVGTYPYYDFEKNKIDFDKMMEHLNTLPQNSIILLHGCCHNPTGCDPTEEQWKALSSLMLRKKLVPFFDMAYQGFGDGLDEDAFAVRYFAEQGHEMLVAFSCAKIFGLYAERVGALFFVGENEHLAQAASTNIKSLIRSNYSNPPKHGAAVVSYIFNHPGLKELWISELNAMRHRIQKMRSMFSSALSQNIKSRDCRYIDSTKGMFCFTGLQRHQVERLIEEFGLYMVKTGRINLTGLNESNLSDVIEAIVQVSV